jgi:hypothetical protein
VPLLWIAGGGLLLWLAFGHGYANYDTLYALLWGNEIAHGESPDYGAPIPPTPHPLATFAGILLAPFGGGAEGIAVAIAFASLAAIGYLTYRLGASWFNPAVGLLAAAIVLTRQPVLSFAVISYVDIPYAALVLAALLVETKRPRAGWPVLALLALAGLLRPEAWLFSAVYLVYLAYTDPRRPRPLAGGLRERLVPLLAFARRREFAGLLAIAASAPLIWALSDLAVTGDPLYSLTGTRETVETLGRDTGLVDAVTLGPRRLGEIVREPVLVGAAGGGLLALALLRRRSLLGAAAGFLAVGAFLVLAAIGLAVITRYLLLAATILIVFAAAGVLGWMELPPEHRWRRWWMAFGGVVALLLVAFVPPQLDRLEELQDAIAGEERIRDDLAQLADSGAFQAECEPISVPNHRPVPLLALRLDRRPSEIVSAQLERPKTGYFVDPATPEVEETYILDPNDPGDLSAEVPPDFTRVAGNRSWNLYARCAGSANG